MHIRKHIERLGELARRVGREERGMSLIEIMVVITIIGLIMGIIGTSVFGALDDAKIDTTKNQMQNLSLALKSYKIANGHYPTSSEGLESLINPPSSAKKRRKFLDADKVPVDAWDGEFMYYSPGTHGDHDFEIVSYGADGTPGGDGANADINSWEL